MKNLFNKLSIKYWVLSIIAVSFMSKLILGYILSDTFFERGNSYHALNSIAYNLIHNFEFAIAFGIPSIDYEPLYPLTLALAYKLFGMNWFGVTFIQAIFYALTSWILFLIGKMLVNELTGLLAATYHSFYPYLFFQSLSIYDTTPFIFIIMSLIYVAMLPEKNRNVFLHYCCIGALIGLSLLLRGSALAMLPPIILYLYLKPSEYNYFKRTVVLIIAALTVLSPWLIRNYHYTETLVISTHGAFGLWQGNNKYSYDYLQSNISLDEVYRRKPPPAIYKENPIKPRLPKEARKISQKYKSEAMHFIQDNPTAFLKLCWIKFIKFWTWTYNPITEQYAIGTAKARNLVYFISYFPLLISIPFGLSYLIKKSPISFVLFFGILITYTLAHMIVMGYSRLRLPLDPILMIFLGITISHFFTKEQDIDYLWRIFRR